MSVSRMAKPLTRLQAEELARSYKATYAITNTSKDVKKGDLAKELLKRNSYEDGVLTTEVYWTEGTGYKQKFRTPSTAEMNALLKAVTYDRLREIAGDYNTYYRIVANFRDDTQANLSRKIAEKMGYDAETGEWVDAQDPLTYSLKPGS